MNANSLPIYFKRCNYNCIRPNCSKTKSKIFHVKFLSLVFDSNCRCACKLICYSVFLFMFLLFFSSSFILLIFFCFRMTKNTLSVFVLSNVLLIRAYLRSYFQKENSYTHTHTNENEIFIIDILITLKYAQKSQKNFF